MGKFLKKYSFSLVFFLTFILFNQNVYANSISFADAVKMSRLKTSKPKNDKANKTSANLSFAQAVKLQKNKSKPLSAQYASYNSEPNYSYTGSSDNNSLKSFILKRNPNVSGEVAEQIVSEVKKHCYKNGIDPKLIIALMTIESNFNKTAVSPVGAMGLGQLMPGTAGDLGINDAFNISQNIRGTVSYLSQLLKIFNGNLELSLASYNMGPNAVKKVIEKNSDIPSSVKDYVYNVKTIRNSLDI